MDTFVEFDQAVISCESIEWFSIGFNFLTDVHEYSGQWGNVQIYTSLFKDISLKLKHVHTFLYCRMREHVSQRFILVSVKDEEKLYMGYSF